MQLTHFLISSAFAAASSIPPLSFLPPATCARLLIFSIVATSFPLKSDLQALKFVRDQIWPNVGVSHQNEVVVRQRGVSDLHKIVVVGSDSRLSLLVSSHLD